jgi:hypothetical protein
VSEIEVGKAYRGTDGLVRWVTHESTRHIYSVLWLDEESSVWYSGGKYRKNEAHYIVGPEDFAPQPGDHYILMGSLGTLREMVA